MKQLYFLLSVLTLTLFFSCNLNSRERSDQEIAAMKAHRDSVTVILDSLYKLDIDIAPLYDKEVFDSATTVRFFDLAKSTKGELKLMLNSKLITNEIAALIESDAKDDADILLLIDKTGSMADDIENIKKGLNQVLNAIRSHNNIHLGIGLYGDKNEDGPDWFSFKNFGNNYGAAAAFINNIEVTAGGDYPESVYDGFFKSCEQHFWRSATKRMIILIGDAPPLDKPLSDYTVSDVIRKAGEDNIKMNFYPFVVTPFSGEIPEKKDRSVITYEKDKLVNNLYPNPVTGVINISFTKNDSYQLEIFNSGGELISTESFSGNLWKKDLSAFKNGAFVVRVIRKDKKFESVKFIVYK